MANYIGHLDPFVAGSNFESYEDRVCQFLIANKVTDDCMKTSVFINIMGQEMYDILKSLTVPDKPSTKTFDELLVILRKHFAPKKNKRAERYKFNKAVQQTGETISEFIVRLKSLAQTCQFGEFTKQLKVADKSDKDKKEVIVDNINVVSNYQMLCLDEALTDRFIVGLSDGKIQLKLMNSDDLTFEECCLIATNMELSQNESKAIQPERSFVNKIDNTQTKGQSKSNNSRGRTMSKSRGVSKSLSHSRSFYKECRRCGRTHNPNNCPAVDWECYICHKIGHTSKMCHNKESSVRFNKPNGIFKRNSPHIKSITTDDDLRHELAKINVVNRKKFKSERFVDREPEERTLNIEGQEVEMETDTGAAATVMCQEEYEERFGHIKLSPVSDEFKVLTGENIRTIGQMEVRVWFNGVLNLLSLIVVATDGYMRALLGRPWLDVLQPNWRSLLLSPKSSKINVVSTKTSQKFLRTLKTKFPKSFEKNNRPIKGFKADLSLKDDTKPIFHAPYSIPFKLRDRFEKELESQVSDSILEPVKFSRWAAPVVLVPKPDDGLSRLPLKEDTNILSFRISYFDSKNSPLNFEKIQRHTDRDNLLVSLRRNLMFGWPNTGEVSASLKSYYVKRNSLALENNCIFYGSRVLVPESLRERILGVLHENHLGVVRMKMVARSYAWWPSIDKDIEDFCSKCVICQQTQRVNKEVVTTVWPTTSYPFERVHIDFFQFQGKTYFLLVDVFSKLTHVEYMVNTSAEKVISVLKNFFVVFGIPTQMVSDNGPPFGSKKLEDFCLECGIKFTNSPPYHPQSNGSAEKYVSSIKCVFKKFLLGSQRTLPIQEKINKFLLHQRTTPSTVTKCAPLDLIFKYKPKTVLDIINNKVKANFDSKQGNCKISENKFTKPRVIKEKHFKKSKFVVGDKVLYRNHFKNSVRWLPARVVEIVSRYTYRIDVHSNIRFVHENQIRKSSLEDKHHPSLSRDLKDSLVNQKVIVPPKSVKSSANPTSPNSSLEFLTPPTSPSQRVGTPKSVKVANKKVSFQVPNTSRGRTQSLSEEGSTSTRQSTRVRRKPIRYGSEADS